MKKKYKEHISDNHYQKEDLLWMLQALEIANTAFLLNEVPVGAVLVMNNTCISKAHNLTETLQDASSHAELLCLRQASTLLRTWRLTEATLYSTLEPCPMCAGALINFRIKRLVWGAPDYRQGGNGGFLDIFTRKHPIHNFPITKNVLSAPSGLLLKKFFKEKRETHVHTKDESKN
jgi:tRNA(adenine34) deaminase